MLPEVPGTFIVSAHEQMALEDLQLRQAIEYPFSQLAPDSSVSVARMYREVMYVTAPSVVTTQHGADQLRTGPG